MKQGRRGGWRLEGGREGERDPLWNEMIKLGLSDLIAAPLLEALYPRLQDPIALFPGNLQNTL